MILVLKMFKKMLIIKMSEAVFDICIHFNFQFEEESEEIGGGAEGGQGKRKRLFSKECK